MLVFLATMVAGSAALVFGKLVQPPPSRKDVKGASGLSTSPTLSTISTAAVFAAAFGAASMYLTEPLEDHSAALLFAVAVLGPLAVAAWEQRVREIRPYRPNPGSALRGEEALDRPEPDVSEPDRVPVVLQH